MAGTAKNRCSATKQPQTNDTAVSTGTRVSNERGAELEKWREAKRSLVFSSDVDGAYIDLYKEAKQDILKLRLKDSTDEAYHRAELQRILKDGGTLVLDLRDADPKLIKEWNSLYDFDAAGKGVQQISEKLVIIALADKYSEPPPESVTSRSAKFYDQSGVKQRDPLDVLKIDAYSQKIGHLFAERSAIPGYPVDNSVILVCTSL